MVRARAVGDVLPKLLQQCAVPGGIHTLPGVHAPSRPQLGRKPAALGDPLPVVVVERHLPGVQIQPGEDVLFGLPVQFGCVAGLPGSGNGAVMIAADPLRHLPKPAVGEIVGEPPELGHLNAELAEPGNLPLLVPRRKLGGVSRQTGDTPAHRFLPPGWDRGPIRAESSSAV